MTDIVGDSINQALRQSNQLCLIKKTSKLPRKAEPFLFGKGLRGRAARRRRKLLPSGSDGQTLTALGAAAFKNQLAGVSLHASAKTVGAAALSSAGLICSFHKSVLNREK
jgi:hypothetical protein